MKRKDFLTAFTAALTLPMVGNPLKAFAKTSSFLQEIVNTDNDRVLVLINLHGGNDGLNTLIPLDQYSNLFTNRANILVPQNMVLNVGAAGTTKGFHPSMVEMKNMHDAGTLLAIQDVGYPSPNLSHFQSQDILMNGSTTDFQNGTGWMGRYLENYYTYSSRKNTYGPPAIEIGTHTSILMNGSQGPLGIAMKSTATAYTEKASQNPITKGWRTDKELLFLRNTANLADQYLKATAAASAKIKTQSAYPANTLAGQLQQVARLIAGGLKTKLYIVTVYGFDTHTSQTATETSPAGIHASLLQQLSSAIQAFQNDLVFLGIANRVIGMTFSEFGRRIRSNSSLGTDHGAASPMFLFGNAIDGGKIIGQNPTINAQHSISDNLPMQYDFRQVYSTILQHWFCMTTAQTQTLLGANYTTLPLIKSSFICVPTFKSQPIYDETAQNTFQVKCFPNPTVERVKISVNIVQESTNDVYLQVYTAEGRQILDQNKNQLPQGSYEFEISLQEYQAGAYYVRITDGLNHKTEIVFKE